MFDTLWPQGLQHARPPCPSPSPAACSNSCPLSQWCHTMISSSVVPFSSYLQSFPVSGYFLMSWLFASGGQMIGASAFSISPSNSGLISFRIYWFDLFVVQWTLKSLLQHAQKHQFFGTQLPLRSNSPIHMWLMEKPCLWLDRPVSAKKWLYFITGCSGCQSFSSKEQASFNFMAADIICSDFGAQENKVSHCFHHFPVCLPWSDRTRCHDLHFLSVEF